MLRRCIDGIGILEETFFLALIIRISGKIKGISFGYVWVWTLHVFNFEKYNTFLLSRRINEVL
eukprot:snap_masked-scaffold_16-processed-gene-6.92-mRNA-1 protein AED:1.00 eAED:1.00 QI:0/0/0/0/1/1/3/0/62